MSLITHRLAIQSDENRGRLKCNVTKMEHYMHLLVSYASHTVCTFYNDQNSL
jgi:hypothetical protein